MSLGAALAERGRSVARAALRLALPQRCPGCAGAGSAERLLCAACEAAVPAVSIAVCARCLARGAEGVGCVRHPGFAVWPAWSYDERAACVVHALKYEGRTGLAAALGPRIVRALPPALAIDLVIPMPLHRARHRERGYNQSERLALTLSRRLGAPCVTDALVRVRATRPQARLERDARRANLRDAFRLTRPEWVRERAVLLVDDVMTTGATFDAALEVLHRHGARALEAALAWAA